MDILVQYQIQNIRRLSMQRMSFFLILIIILSFWSCEKSPEEAYDNAKKEGSIEAYNSFISKYPDSPFIQKIIAENADTITIEIGKKMFTQDFKDKYYVMFRDEAYEACLRKARNWKYKGYLPKSYFRFEKGEAKREYWLLIRKASEKKYIINLMAGAFCYCYRVNGAREKFGERKQISFIYEVIFENSLKPKIIEKAVEDYEYPKKLERIYSDALGA
jgi:hypothetical protein